MWKRTQARLVDRIKRRAIRRLHRSPRGEARLLQIYLWAEEGAEAEVPSAPAWLRDQLAAHVADERRHALMLRNRLRQLGHGPTPPRVDPISRAKLARMRKLAAKAAAEFRAGACVPVMAVAFRAETMGVRVLRRHVAEIDGDTRPILQRILADEERHVAECESALARLVADDERPALDALVARIDRAERAFGVTAALALLALAEVTA
jgi:rubrerythrin